MIIVLSVGERRLIRCVRRLLNLFLFVKVFNANSIATLILTRAVNLLQTIAVVVTMSDINGGRIASCASGCSIDVGWHLTPPDSSKLAISSDAGDGYRLRRWDSAETNRLNASQWKKAHGEHINRDLLEQLETLRARSSYESQNNPFVEGVINTHCVDVVGETGPALDIDSDDKKFNEEVKLGWEEFANDMSPSGNVQLPDEIKLWVRQLWVYGEYFNQETSYLDRENLNGKTPLRFSIQSIYPKRIDTPVEHINDERVLMGVRFNSNDRPIQYYKRVDNPARNPYRYGGIAYDPIDADMMNHVFERLEVGQVRGVPWLASSLQVISDLRKHDEYVLEAAKSAAAQGIVWHTNHPDSVFQPVPDGTCYSLEKGVQTYAPAGWQPSMIEATQPTAVYQAFRHERLRELGRPVGMPLMVVLLSSADSNFSSAHYDGQIYMRFLGALQRFIERQTLNLFLRKVVAELLFIKRIKSIPPLWKSKFTWPKAPYVNPKDMYDALRAMLEDGTASYPDVLAAYGRDEETVIATRKRTNERLKEAGLPELPVNEGNKKPDPPPMVGGKLPNGKPKPNTSKGSNNVPKRRAMLETT